MNNKKHYLGYLAFLGFYLLGLALKFLGYLAPSNDF